MTSIRNKRTHAVPAAGWISLWFLLAGGPSTLPGQGLLRDRIRIARFQVRALQSSAVLLEDGQKKEEAVKLLRDAYRVGSALFPSTPGGAPAGWDDAKGQASTLATEIGSVIPSLEKVWKAFDLEGAKAGIPGLYRRQIDILEAVSAPAERKVECRLGLITNLTLEWQGGAVEIGSLVREAARLLEAAGPGHDELWKQLSAKADEVLQKWIEEPGASMGSRESPGIIADLGAGRPGADGRKALQNLVNRSRKDLGSDPGRIHSFYLMAREVWRLLAKDAHAAAGWEEGFAEELLRIKFLPRALSGDSSKILGDMHPSRAFFRKKEVSPEDLVLRLEGTDSPLPSLRDLGLTDFFLPRGPFRCFLELKGMEEDGYASAVFEVPETIERSITLVVPVESPRDGILVLFPGVGVVAAKVWAFGKEPLSGRGLAGHLFQKKGGTNWPLAGESLMLFQNCLGTPENELRTKEDLENTLKKIGARADGPVRIGHADMELARLVFRPDSLLPTPPVARLLEPLLVARNKGPIGSIRILDSDSSDSTLPDGEGGPWFLIHPALQLDFMNP